MTHRNLLAHKGHRQSRPRPGTKIGRAYDLYRSGEYIRRPYDIAARHWFKIREELRNYWDMEFECNGLKGCRCIGMWDGPYFVPIDHISED